MGRRKAPPGGKASAGRRIFISYRRGDTSGQARALQETLSARFGHDSVFMDVDSIGPGMDFVEQIDQAISSCSVVLALIGRDWAGRQDAPRLLEDTNDFVRREIESALQHRIPVIPILIERALMPAPSTLPDSLQPLTRINALELENSRWSYDVSRLGDAIERLPAAAAATSVDAPPPPPPPAAARSESQRPAQIPPPPVETAPPPPPAAAGQPSPGPPAGRRSNRLWWFIGAGAALVAAAVALIVVFVVLPHPPPAPPSPSHRAQPSPTAPPTLAAAVLNASDFTAGATNGSASDVPDLNDVKCTPDQSAGLQAQNKSEVTASSGRIYHNVVAQFDNTSDAATFLTTFLAGAPRCSDAASSPQRDNFGDASFYFTIAGTPNDLGVETVQVGRYVTMVIQSVPDGSQPDRQSLNDLTQTSVDKVKQLPS